MIELFLQHKKILVLSGCLLFLLMGFLAVFLFYNQTFNIRVETRPSEATIKIAGETKRSPAEFRIKRGAYEIIIEKSGYTSIKESFHADKSKTGYYYLIKSEETSYNDFLQKLPIEKEGFTIFNGGTDIIVEIKKGPAQQFIKEAKKILEEEKIDPDYKNIIWNIPAHLR